MLDDVSRPLSLLPVLDGQSVTPRSPMSASMSSTTQPEVSTITQTLAENERVAERGKMAYSGTISVSFSTTFSMPVMAMCRSGRVVHIRPLPSFSTKHSVPVSATAKFTPEMPTSAWR